MLHRELPMTDRSALAVLRQGVREWNEWRATHAQAKPDLAGSSLCGLDLVEANLAGADLGKADLRGANLSRADLSGANLEAANFFKCTLDDADLSGANLLGAQFLRCVQLVAARNWQSCQRDAELGCGAPIPSARHRH